MFPTAVQEIFCTFKLDYSVYLEENVNTCFINQTIDNDAYVLGSPVNTSVEQVFINRNNGVKDLPRNIGDKFANLIEFWATRCQLTTVRNHYFMNMQKLKFLNLRENKITTIEPDAFKDLISIHRMNLQTNMIETLDENIFTAMVALEWLHLEQNKIKLLKPETFIIPGGKLSYVVLKENVCINKWYGWDNWGQLEPDLKANCTQ